MDNSAFLINPHSLTDHFSDATYQRGLAVYHSQHVLECSIASGAQNEWFIDGLVLGSKYDNYNVEVALETNAQGSVTYYEGTCSCPVGIDCNHCLAVTLKAAYKAGISGLARANAPALPTHAEQQRLKDLQARQALEQEQRVAQHKVTQWLDLFGDAQAMPDTSDAPDSFAAKGSENTVVYALSAKHVDHYEVLNLTMGIAKRLRNGNWSKLKTIPYYDREKTSPLAADIQRLVKSMSGAQYYYSNLSEHQCVLAGSTGVLAMQLAASSGHLFFCEQERSLGAAMQTGAPRPMAWKWNEVTNLKSTEPSWALSPDRSKAQVHERWYFNTPPMYIDIDSGEYGLLEMPGVSSAHLALLVKAPPIPQSAFAKHETSFLRRLAGLPLPPVMHPPQVLQGITPTARLHIAAVAAHDVARFGPLMATLRFDYGAVAHFTQSLANPIVIEKDAALSGAAAAPSERWLLHRDMAFEQSSISRLIALGLAGDARGHFSLAFTPSAQLPQWLAWADSDYAQLRALGFEITLEPNLQDWIKRADDLHVQLAGQGSADLAGTDDSQSPWFDLSLGISINGQRHNILPMLPSLLAQLQTVVHRSASGPDGIAQATSDESTSLQLPTYVYLPTPEGQYLRLPTEPLRPWLQALIELVGDRPIAAGADTLRLSRFEALQMGASLGAGAVWAGADSLRLMVQQLHGVDTMPEVALPDGVNAQLRPYQQQGLNWLQFLRTHQLSGILADDMGLGKTLQTLVHIAAEKAAGRLDLPVLIVAPVSVLGNWQREIGRFTPALTSLIWHGAERHEDAAHIGKQDILITSYSLLARDSEHWAKQAWHLVVLDEAQNIKNAHTFAAQAAGQLNTRHRLCLSGTPMENHLGELWSLFHFLMPGFLGSQTRFKELFRTPIEKHGDTARLAHLRRRVTPFMLRRAKREVATELPDKQTSITSVELGDKQANLYETIRLTTEKAVQEALANKGLARSQIQVLDALLKLRQVCCDPRLVPTASAKKIKQSAKLELLMELLPQLLAQGRKVLLFSQFTSMLELIEEELAKQSIPWVKLTGQSQKRDAIITRFTSGEVPLFLISLKAGGVGLNLTQADTVIHYDPWWNPAVENQATDRAHRIGQTQQVMVYKLVAQGTIEERMLQLQERKAQLAESMYSDAAARKQPLFTENDLAELLKPLHAVR